jgi:ubiquinone/menaquinone biosynthesis C-methylase UbiE
LDKLAEKPFCIGNTLFHQEVYEMEPYVHGYTEKESCRLADQAKTLTELLHHDTRYPAGSRVLEAGCGIGAQTVILSKNSPDARFIAIDISRDSIDKAKKTIREEDITNVTFRKADILDLPFEQESFDHVFVCFVLEHLPNPADALIHLGRVLKKGGTITVIEGDHGSFYCHPESKEALLTVECLIEIQARLKGNSLIGRQLYPLLNKAGYEAVRVSPRMVYVDSSRPGLVDGFSKKTFIAMVEGVREQALSFRLIDEKTWVKGIGDLYRATEDDGTFCYTFFKGTALKR